MFSAIPSKKLKLQNSSINFSKDFFKDLQYFFQSFQYNSSRDMKFLSGFLQQFCMRCLYEFVLSKMSYNLLQIFIIIQIFRRKLLKNSCCYLWRFPEEIDENFLKRLYLLNFLKKKTTTNVWKNSGSNSKGKLFDKFLKGFLEKSEEEYLKESLEQCLQKSHQNYKQIKVMENFLE